MSDMSPWSWCLLGRKQAESAHTPAEVQRFQGRLILRNQLEHKKKMGACYLSVEKDPRFLQEILFPVMAGFGYC